MRSVGEYQRSPEETRQKKSVCPVPSLMRSLGLVFGVGMAVGIGGLLAMPAKMQEPRPLFARWREEAPPPCAQQVSSKTGSKTSPITWPKFWSETEPRCQVGTQVETTARRGLIEAAKAKATPATAPVAKPPSPPESPASRDVASAVATPPDQAAPAQTKPTVDRAPKSRKAALSRIPVTVHASDNSQRTIMINPTSRQDAYYYTARRNVGVGATVW